MLVALKQTSTMFSVEGMVFFLSQGLRARPFMNEGLVPRLPLQGIMHDMLQ